MEISTLEIIYKIWSILTNVQVKLKTFQKLANSAYKLYMLIRAYMKSLINFHRNNF